MRYELFIGLRYLRAKRKEAFISLITIISMLGVMIGVMTLNVALAIMTGFEEDLRDRILGFNPHIVVLNFEGPIGDYETALARVRRDPEVVAAGPFIYGQVMLSAGEQVNGVVVRGVPSKPDGVLDLQKNLKEGNVEDLGRLYEVAVEGADSMAKLPGLIVGQDVGRCCCAS